MFSEKIKESLSKSITKKKIEWKKNALHIVDKKFKVKILSYDLCIQLIKT